MPHSDASERLLSFLAPHPGGFTISKSFFRPGDSRLLPDA